MACEASREKRLPPAAEKDGGRNGGDQDQAAAAAFAVAQAGAGQAERGVAPPASTHAGAETAPANRVAKA